MIQVNLLPEEFRVVEKKQMDLPILKIGIAAAALFVLLTIFFYIDFVFVSAKLHKIEVGWKKIQPEFVALNKLQSEVDNTLKQEKDFMEKFVTAQKPLTILLMWASEFLPPSTWLIELELKREGEGSQFLVKGLCLPSKSRSSIEQIEDYLQHLKEQMPDAALSLTTTRQKSEGVELTQFTASFVWGKKPKT